MVINNLEEIRKRVHETSIYISDITPETKSQFLALAKKEFKDHYGWTLKWLMDFRKGLLSNPNQQLADRITLLEQEINQVKEDEKKQEPKAVIKTLSGRVLKTEE